MNNFEKAINSLNQKFVVRECVSVEEAKRFPSGKVQSFSHQYKVPIECSNCGIKPTHIIQLQSRSSKSVKVRNFYSLKGHKFILFNIDHIVPLSRGGLCHSSNCRIMCADCNTKRGNVLSESDLQLVKVDPSKYIGKSVFKQNTFYSYIQTTFPEVFYELFKSTQYAC